MDGKKVTITYTDEFGIWPNLVEDFRSNLPLRNLTWKSANRPVRIIQALPVELKKFVPGSNESQHEMPVTLLERPYLHLYFVNCDDHETYRQEVRKQIRDWLNVITFRKNQEWLIVYVSKQDTARTSASKYFNMKGTVFDKIKADFNTSKRDRCVQLRLNDHDTETFEIWQDLILKIKEGILSSFGQHVTQYEEDVRRLDAQRSVPGWNYCRFFIQKEGLAQSFEIMNLYEDALLQYDELEASFFQVLKDRALAWFGKFGACEPGDDSANILDIRKKPYRELIMQNSISVFDFRSYLFARQCQLLGRLQRPVEICRRAQLFISSFARSIKENMMDFEHFLESWVYSSCINVVGECEELAPLTTPDEKTSAAFNAAKGELLDLARKQLDKLGIYYGHLPEVLPFTTALSEASPASVKVSETGDEKKSGVTNKELLEAISSISSFDSLYMRQTNRVLKAYQGSMRTRSLLRLQGDIAALQFHRKNYEEAMSLMEELPNKYGEQGWTVIENALLINYAACMEELGHTKEYPFHEATQYAEKLKTLSEALDKEIVRPFKPMFTVTVTAMVDDITDDEPYLGVEVKNNLPISFKIERLGVRLVGGQTDDEVWFAIHDQDFNPGVNSYRLFSDTTACGSYIVENCRLHIGKLVFTHNFLNENKKKLFRINEHPAVLRAQVITPTEIHIGEQQHFIAQVHTGRTSISDGRLTLVPLSEGLSFPSRPTYHAVVKPVVDDTVVDEIVKEEQMDASEDGIKLPSCGPNQLLQLKVLYDCNWGDVEHKVKITVEYTSKDKRRVFTAKNIVKVWLPLAVTETSIFREDSLILKMNVTLNDALPVRLLSTKLIPSKAYEVTNSIPISSMSSPITIFPRQQASFMYKLTHNKDVDDDEIMNRPSTQIHCLVEYRTLKDEIQHFAKEKLHDVLKSYNMSQHSDSVFENIRERFLELLDYHSYGIRDILDLGELDIVGCEQLFQNHGDVKGELVNAVREFWEKYNKITFEEVQDNGKNLKSVISFPIDVPLSKILNTVELVIPNSKHLVVGEPCHCVLVVRQSPYWNHKQQTEAIEFYYDVNVDFDNWLLSGQKKFCFSYKMNETREFPITLIPLKTGRLLVPFIRVASISSSIFSESVYINNAQQVLVRPRTQSATFFIEQQHRIHPMGPATGLMSGHHGGMMDEIAM